MPRAAIYARYSDRDLQDATSIEDQVRLCRVRAVAMGHDVGEIYSDAGISGAGILNRPAIVQLMADAKAGKFQVLIAEALDRMSRDQEDIAGVFKRLSFAGVSLVTLAEGEITEIHIGFKGTMNAVFLKDLAAKVRRGQAGQVIRGRAPGGLAYGYRVVRRFGPDGKPENGLREIDPDQAAIVRRIFEEFAGGRSAIAIAQGLNAEGHKGPRGGRWNPTAINGNAGRGNGILCNRLYLGEIIYNRINSPRDPETGRKRARRNPKASWTVVPAPAMRIIDDELWNAAQAMKARQAGARESGGGLHMTRRPKRLLSGLVRCGTCGGAYIVVDAERMGCAANKQGHGCTNGRRVATERLETRVLEGLKAQLLAPELVAAAVKDYHQARLVRRSQAVTRRARTERELVDVTAKIERLVAAIAAGADVPQIRQGLQDLDARRRALAEDLADAGDMTVVPIEPKLADVYRGRVERLVDSLNSLTAPKAEAFQILRGLIDAITLHPTEARGGFEIELQGQLQEILRLAGEGDGMIGSDAVPNQGLMMASPRGLALNPLIPQPKVRFRL